MSGPGIAALLALAIGTVVIVFYLRAMLSDGAGSPLWPFSLAVLVLLGALCALALTRPSRPFTIFAGALVCSVGAYILSTALRTPRRDIPQVPRQPAISLRVTLIVLAGAAGFAIYAGASSLIEGLSSPVPPPGTIVDATTGQEVTHIASRTTPQFVQVGGGKIFQACDLTTHRPCGYVKPGAPLRVRAGDIIEFSTLLFNPNNRPVPYLEMYAETYGSSAGPGDWIRMVIQWRTKYDQHSRLMKAGGVQPVEIVYPRTASFPDMTYVPGSTVLFNNRGQAIARLSDGIMENGIALTNVGAPASCSYCETRYTRYVNFKVRVTEHGRA